MSGDAEVYEKHRDELTRFARVLVGRDDAPDVVSSVVTRVLASGRALTELDEPRSYLMRAVLNESRSLMRKRRDPLVRLEAHHDPLVDPRITEAVFGLPPRQRAALGTIDDLLAFRIIVQAFDRIHICDWTVAFDQGRPRPLGACAFNEDPRPEVTVTARSLRLTIDASDLPEGATATGPVTVGSPVTQVIWSTLEAQVAVVALTVEGEPVQLWQRPVAGVAVFVATTQTDDPQFELTAYDQEGKQIRTITAALP